MNCGSLPQVFIINKETKVNMKLDAIEIKRSGSPISIILKIKRENEYVIIHMHYIYILLKYFAYKKCREFQICVGIQI